jgi:hypothetical protein
MAKRPLVIWNDADLTAALKRADELMGCTDCSDEERELAAEVTCAIDVYTDAMHVLRKVGEDDAPNPQTTQLGGEE